jgi:hypothetical protein
MSFDISDEIKQLTVDCKKGFPCLEGIKENLCKVEHCVNGATHFIRRLNKKSCSYQTSFGNAFICSCPIRKELYNKFNV